MEKTGEILRWRGVDHAITKSSAFPLAFMGHAEVTNGPWFAYGDYVFVRLRFSGSTLKLRSPIDDVSVALDASGHMRTTLGIGEAGVGYELGRWKLSNAPASFTALDAYAGMRYLYLGADLTMQALGAADVSLLGVTRSAHARSQNRAEITGLIP